MNHAGAFGAANQMNALAGHFEPGEGGFGPRIGSADRQGEFGKGTSRGPAIARDPGQRAKNLFDGQGYADDAGGTNEDLLRAAVEAASGFFDGFHRSSIAGRAGGAIGVARIDDDRAHAALRRTQVRLRNHHGGSDDEILREHGGSRGGYVA